MGRGTCGSGCVKFLGGEPGTGGIKPPAGEPSADRPPDGDMARSDRVLVVEEI
jgi:hypothetical protein